MTSSGTRTTRGGAVGQELPRLARVLAVCAHPDDESFGLGAVLAALVTAGTSRQRGVAAAGHENLTVIAWAIPGHVAEVVNAEFATSVTGRPPQQIDLTITVDRTAQLKAIACHASQSNHNQVLWRRLDLLGRTEHLRYLRTGPRAVSRRLPRRP